MRSRPTEFARGCNYANLVAAMVAALRALAFLILASVAPTVSAAEVRILVQSSPLAGFQFHAAGALWDRLREGDALTLVREPENPHDPRAVRVEWKGVMLGYLPRRQNTAVAAAIDRGEPVGARIAKLREHRNPWQRILIEVFVAL